MTSPRRYPSKPDVAKASDYSLERWLAPLRDLPEPPRANTETAQARRASQIQKLAVLINQAPVEQVKARRHLQWRWGVAAAAMAVAASTTFFLFNEAAEPSEVVQNADARNVVLRHLFGQVVSSQQGRSKVLTQGAELSAGDELSTTAEAFASLDIGAVRVDLTSATTLALMRTSERDQAYKLRAGRVDVSVPHVPGEARRVEVVTSDSVVKVRGTVFSVEVTNVSGTSVTRVEVTRGSVGVENAGKTHVVNAGDRWVSPPTKDIATTESTSLPEQTSAELEAHPDVSEATTPPRPSVERSSLKDQNQLFSRALQAQRRGNHKLAVQLYSALLRRYPDSPLASTARTELEQAQQQLDRKR